MKTTLTSILDVLSWQNVKGQIDFPKYRHYFCLMEGVGRGLGAGMFIYWHFAVAKNCIDANLEIFLSVYMYLEYKCRYFQYHEVSWDAFLF